MDEDQPPTMALPEGMTEEGLFSIFRELIGLNDEISDAELRDVFCGDVFQELFPDIEIYWKERQRRHNKRKKEVDSYSHSKPKEESIVPEEAPRAESPGPSTEFLWKKGSDSDIDAAGSHHSHVSDNHSHHKKKKKKHKKEHKKDKHERKETDCDREKERQKTQPFESEEPKISLDPGSNTKDLKHDSSDSDDEAPKKNNKPEQPKKEIIWITLSSDSEDDGGSGKQNLETDKKEESESRKDDREQDADIIILTEIEEKSKVHPLDEDKKVVPSTSSQPPVASVKQEAEKKKEPKPFSRYQSSASQINLRTWRPVLHPDHLKYEGKFRLKPVSITCVDLLDFPMVFCDPHVPSKNPTGVPLQSGVALDGSMFDMLRRLELDKLTWFRRKLNKQVKRGLKGQKRSIDSPDDDDDRKSKKRKIVHNFSSGESPQKDSKKVASKGSSAVDDKRKDKISNLERDEERRRQVAEIKRKQDLILKQSLNKNKPRVPDRETNNKKTDEAKERRRAVAEKRKRQEERKQKRLEEERLKSSASLNKILAQIIAANKEEASKPKVELINPQQSSQQPHPTDVPIKVGEVAHEVIRLLSAPYKVEFPVMPGSTEDLGEYTVKKIGWWFLKNEKDPPLEGVFHPEHYDDDVDSSDDVDDFDWPDDVSSLNGCVSDPDGISAEIPLDRNLLNDPDWIDEYCGLATLYANVRRNYEIPKTMNQSNYKCLESSEGLKSIMRIRPGTNYEKASFEVKCIICDTVIKGQRQYGAHIRGDAHKNMFRNFSLNMAKYEEKMVKVPPKKVFRAKLVEYSVNPGSSASVSSDETNKDNVEKEEPRRKARIERPRSLSPAPIVAGDAGGNIEVVEMPIPDEDVFPDYEDYNIPSDESLMNVKVAIRIAGKWNNDLEKRWRSWKDEEAKLTEVYNKEREYYINNPEFYPCYADELRKFWKERDEEAEQNGDDPKRYDFWKDWQTFWFKRMQEIMLEKVEEKVFDLKRRLRIDKRTLRQQFGIKESETRRKSLKGNASSHKSLEQPGPSGQQRQYPSRDTTRQTFPSNHKKPSSLPTPPDAKDGPRHNKRKYKDQRHNHSGGYGNSNRGNRAIRGGGHHNRRYDNNRGRSTFVNPNNRHSDSRRWFPKKHDRGQGRRESGESGESSHRRRGDYSEVVEDHSQGRRTSDSFNSNHHMNNVNASIPPLFNVVHPVPPPVGLQIPLMQGPQPQQNPYYINNQLPQPNAWSLLWTPGNWVNEWTENNYYF